MRVRRHLALSAAGVALATMTPLALSVAAATPGAAASSSSASPVAVSAQRVGTFNLSASSSSNTEIRSSDSETPDSATKAVANRSPRSHAKSTRGTPPPSGITPTQTLGVNTSASGWSGLNHFDQRRTDGGNQWSLTPPDQALCTNGTQVLEGVNVALRVYDTSGNALTDPVAFNPAFWGDHEVIRNSDGTVTTSPHQMGDPDCVYDPGTGQFFFSVYDQVNDTSGNATGPSFIDIAVSQPNDATGTWTTYQLDTTDNGLDGTPSDPHCPCFADYPHLSTDANGVYITTNEYSSVPFGAYFNGANVYALAKSAFTSGSSQVTGQMINTANTDLYKGTLYAGATLAPVRFSGNSYPSDGTMYFLSSDAFSGDTPIVSSQILVWKLTGASTLGSTSPSVSLTHTTVAVNAYAVPPASDQKAGSTPLADCLNLTSCAKAVLGNPDKYKESEYSFDSSDTRMLQSAYANGLLWGALDTAVDTTTPAGTVTKAGVAYYVVDPLANSLVKQGTIAVVGENISFPALGVTAAGKGVMALTLTGTDYYPSAAYVTVDGLPGNTASDVHVVGAGLSPDDDFSGYRGFLYNIPRWGDYGAAAVVGSNVWVASEYIAQQPCSLSQFIQTSFTCGSNQRTALANWATHIAVVPTS